MDGGSGEDLEVVGLRIASVSRVRNFSGRIVASARSIMHAARRAMLYAMRPRRRTFSYVVKETSRWAATVEETDEEDEGGLRSRARWKKEGKRDCGARPMGASSFFVMIVILEPDQQPRASGPAGRLPRAAAAPLLDFLLVRLAASASGRYRDFNSPLAWAIDAPRRTYLADAIRYACRGSGVDRSGERFYAPAGLARNEQNRAPI